MTNAVPPAQKSTTDRIFQSVGAAAIRSAFRLAERVSPAFGARWGEALWFTPPRNRRRRAAPPLTGTPFETAVRWDTAAPAAAGDALVSDLPRGHVPSGRVVGETWGDGPAVYLLHGWGGHRGQLRALVDPLVAAGYRVIAFDTPSHGASSPGPSGRRQATLLEAADALAAAVAAGGPAHGVVAHSAGCMATAFAMQAGLAVPRVAFIAPMAEFAPIVPVFAEQLGMGERVLARTIARVEQRVRRPLAAFDVGLLAPRLAASGAQLLLAHDRDDPEIPWSGSKAIAAAWPGARLISTSGLGHRRILRDPDVITEVTAFMGQPSAASSAPAAS